LTGFLGQGKVVAQALGIQNIALAEYPGIPTMDSKDDLSKKVTDILVKNIITGFSRQVKNVAQSVEPGQRDIIFGGSLDEIQEYFHKNLWTDGLPIIPPTLDRVEKFMKFTERRPDEIIGKLLPENREATVWNVAVNGVMAGCRPEYLPILLALVEAISDPEFRIQDAGSTPGWEPIIILNGPIIKQLGFNYETGVMRVGNQSNTSIGRFLRLYMRNVAGLRPGTTDKGSIGTTFNVVLPENEDVIDELGWESFSVSRGFGHYDNVVTVQSVVSQSDSVATGGERAVDHLQTLVDIIGTALSARAEVNLFYGKSYPLIVVSPSVARFIAKEGMTKKDIKQYFYSNTKVSVKAMERLARQGGMPNFDLCKLVEDGILPKDYCESTDPGRMVPAFIRPDWIGIVVSGDPGRTRCRGYAQNHEQGPPISKKIVLPSVWNQFLELHATSQK
jgi:hypothetical protein